MLDLARGVGRGRARAARRDARGRRRRPAARRARGRAARARPTLLGPQPLAQIPTWMAACDVLVLPSHVEGTPNVVLEALACGRRVVAIGGRRRPRSDHQPDARRAGPSRATPTRSPRPSRTPCARRMHPRRLPSSARAAAGRRAPRRCTPCSSPPPVLAFESRDDAADTAGDDDWYESEESTRVGHDQRAPADPAADAASGRSRCSCSRARHRAGSRARSRPSRSSSRPRSCSRSPRARCRARQTGDPGRRAARSTSPRCCCPTTSCSQLIEKRDLFRLRKKLGTEFAIDELREQTRASRSGRTRSSYFDDEDDERAALGADRASR